jgi:hypothetical protein
MSYGAKTRLVSEVITAVQRQFGDESGVQLENADVIRWINDAQDVIVAKNKVLKAKSSTPSVAEQGSYTFPSDNIHQVESIHYDGVRIPNMSFPEAEEHIFQADPLAVATGIPVLWYEWAGTFTFWPAPNDVKTIDLYYTQRPAPVDATSDVLSVPDKYYQDVVRYCLQQAYEMDEDMANSQAKAQQFDASLNEKSEEERTAQNMTYEKITVYNDYEW